MSLQVFLAGTCMFFCALWIIGCLWALRSLSRVPLLGKISFPEPSSWPRLSVVIAARNEEATIRAAALTLLAQDYPEMELVIVEDRSTDGTAKVAEEVASADPRARVVRISELPDGWLGKVYALDRGLKASSGEWVLFTDADVHFKPGALKKAVSHVLGMSAGHLSLLPNMKIRTLMEEAVMGAFCIGYLNNTGASGVIEPSDRGFAGAGAFNLFRRSALDKTPGLEWLRLEVMDDVGLGMMLHMAGERSLFALALDNLEIDWYPSLGAMVKGLEKNFFAAARYSYARVAVMVGLLTPVVAAPTVALFAFGHPYLQAAGAIGYLCLAAIGAACKVRIGSSFTSILLNQVGNLILIWTMVRSAFLCWKRGGVLWRGTLYPLDSLRRMQRVKL